MRKNKLFNVVSIIISLFVSFYALIFYMDIARCHPKMSVIAGFILGFILGCVLVHALSNLIMIAINENK